MPEAFMATTTSPGPGVGSGNSRSSSFRPPRKTTPRIRPPLRLPYHQFRVADRPRRYRDANDQARRGDDLPRDRDRPVVVSDRIHAARLEPRDDRRSSSLAQAALLRRADGGPGLADPDVRRQDSTPHDPDRYRRRQRQGANPGASVEH